MINPKTNDEWDDLDRYLVGKQLQGGWVISEPRRVERDHPSSCRCYCAVNGAGVKAFVKILDNRLTDLDKARLELDRFVYERDIVNKCRTRNMRRVVQGLEYGYIEIPGLVPLVLHYLVFEWADSDVRSRIELDGPMHHAHCLRWLHHATTAIEELHFSEISHQDVKPANLLVRETLEAKLGDLGRAIDGSARRADLEIISDRTRDLTYAPPEMLYARPLQTLEDRFAADIYQLGAMAVYLFTGMGMTMQLMRDIPAMHHWRHWRGSWEAVLPFLAPQFEAAMSGFADSIDSLIRESLVTVVSQLCEPDPGRRGYPAHLLSGEPRYGVRRYVSAFNELATRAEHALRVR